MSIHRQSYQHVYIEQGKKVVEKTEGRNALLFLYTSVLGRFFRPLLRSHIVSSLYGWFQNSRLSTFKIKKFTEKHAIKMEDFIVPSAGYSSFNDFFCRKLAPDVRPVDGHQRALISPADAKCWTLPEVTAQSTFFVKQQNFSLASFLRDDSLAEYFEGGSLFVLRLAPYDYHRFHMPLTGVISEPKILSGTLESVNPLTFKAGGMPLIENERHLMLVESAAFGCNVAVMPVGAMFVGKIGYSAQLPGRLDKGDELGYFAFGGSTIVILVPHGLLRVRADLAAYTARGFEVAVKVGESLGTFVE